MDDKDREIIRLLQGDFPLTPEPYRAIGDKLWLDEMSVISRIAKLIQTGAIRHFGPFFDSRKLGYTGALIAMEVPEHKLEDVIDLVNSYDEITHNYLRDGKPNMWFTVIARDAARRDQILDEIRANSGIQDILVFPSRRLFKVRVDLD